MRGARNRACHFRPRAGLLPFDVRVLNPFE